MKNQLMNLLLATLLLSLTLTACGEPEPKEDTKIPDNQIAVTDKPAIYLYPETPTAVTVKLTFDGELTCTYPAYQNGWQVYAQPDGRLTANGREYYCLYWEGISNSEYDLTKGFCIRGDETAAFLETALDTLGLSEREANEFIIYWLPRMEANEYNLISFQTETYTDSARLEITPQPDSLIRVFMAWRGLDAPCEIAPQELCEMAAERVGFTAVEWGGCEVG